MPPVSPATYLTPPHVSSLPRHPTNFTSLRARAKNKQDTARTRTAAALSSLLDRKAADRVTAATLTFHVSSRAPPSKIALQRSDCAAFLH